MQLSIEICRVIQTQSATSVATSTSLSTNFFDFHCIMTFPLAQAAGESGR